MGGWRSGRTPRIRPDPFRSVRSVPTLVRAGVPGRAEPRGTTPLASRHMASRHHPVVRVTHWVSAFAFVIMVGSGLRIFNAYPRFSRKGERFCCWPFEGTPAPEWLTFGGWLAGARNWHFAMMWVLVAAGLVYVAFIWLHGEWRDLVPRRGTLRDAWEMVRFYSFARADHPRQGKHN